jgi:hypothetical protein
MLSRHYTLNYEHPVYVGFVSTRVHLFENCLSKFACMFFVVHLSYAHAKKSGAEYRFLCVFLSHYVEKSTYCTFVTFFIFGLLEHMRTFMPNGSQSLMQNICF